MRDNDSLQLLVSGCGQTKQPLSLVTGHVLRQELLAMQKDAAVAFNEEGAHGFREWPLAREGKRLG